MKSLSFLTHSETPFGYRNVYKFAIVNKELLVFFSVQGETVRNELGQKKKIQLV
jgi:hypothetical protein